jgi:D-psicose/D-tagatose/L-ribulose 3-epimerase
MEFELSNLGVSSIGWEPAEDARVSETLSSFGIYKIDLTPSKYFAWDDVNAIEKAKEIRKAWASKNFQIRGVQSLLFGMPDWNILDKGDWKSLFNHFENVFNITETLGAKFLVFGSPANRKLGNLAKSTGFDLAEEFFSEISQMLSGRELMVTIEANPVRYGSDFITSTDESTSLVSRIGSPQIRAQLDLGTCLINNEKLDELNAYSESFGYVHLSNMDLNPLHQEPNRLVGEYIGNPFAGNNLTIEQKSPPGEASKSIKNSIEFLLAGKKNYGNPK